MRLLLQLSPRKSLRRRNLPPPRRSLLPPKNKPSPLLPPKMRDRLPLRVRLTSATVVTPTAEVEVTTEVMVVEAAVGAAIEAEIEAVVVATADPAKMLTASSPRVTPRTSPVETTTIGVEVETAVTTVVKAVEAEEDVEAVVEATGEEEDLKLPTERAVPPKIMEGTRLRTTDNSSEGIRLNMRMQMLYLISRGRLSILEDD